MFGDGVPNLLFAMFCLWAFGVFLLAATVLAAALTSKGFVCMVAVGLFAVILNIINIVPAAGRYNPVSLAGTSMMLLTGGTSPGELYAALAVAGIAAAVFTLLAVVSFNRRQAM